MSDHLSNLRELSEAAKRRFCEELSIEQRLYASRLAGTTEEEREQNHHRWLTQHARVMRVLGEYRQLEDEYAKSEDSTNSRSPQ